MASTHPSDDSIELTCVDENSHEGDILFIESLVPQAFHLNGFYIRRFLQVDNNNQIITAYVQFQGDYFLYPHMNQWTLSTSWNADHHEAYTLHDIWASDNNNPLSWKLFLPDEDIEDSSEGSSIDIEMRVILSWGYDSIYHALYHARRLNFETDANWTEKHR